MFDIHTAILDVIRENDKLVGEYLDSPPIQVMRNHAFLGSIRKELPTTKWRFSQYGNNDGFHPCILTQVYRRLYPEIDNRVSPSELYSWHPKFELYRVDCTFLAAPRVFKEGLPIEWEYDWMVEVENNPREFAYHLRGLLDFNCRNRLAIFFVDGPDDQIGSLTDEFRSSWRPFATKNQFASELNLQVLFFPSSYNSCDTYCAQSRSYLWDTVNEAFRRI